MTCSRNSWGVSVVSLLFLIIAGSTSQSEGLHPPQNVEIAATPIGQTLTPTSAVIEWDPVENANSYIVVIFKIEDEVVVAHKEVKNIPETRIEFDDLAPSTNYTVSVTAVRVHFNGTTEMSNTSEPLFFETKNACLGGMIHVPCSSEGCVPTCERRRPACPRLCIAGCSCPKHIPIFRHGKCVTEEACKTGDGPNIEVVTRPTALSIHRIRNSRDLLFTWNKVKGANYYRVLVLLADGTEVQRHDKIKANVIIIKNLLPKVKYRFKVQAIFTRPSASSRTFIWTIPLNDPEITKITEDSFAVQWMEYPAVQSYNLVIEDVDSGEILQIFKDLQETYVVVQGLSPGTTYNVSVIAIMVINQVESKAVSVKTKGTKGDKDPFFNDPAEISHVAEDTTTTTTTMAPTTTTLALTCLDEKQATEAFLAGGFDDGARVPDCDSNGNYKPAQCFKSGCYCVNTISGKKIDGSDFKSKTSRYSLNCAHYGNFKIAPIVVNARSIDTTSIRVRWKAVNAASFYVVKVFNGFEGGFVKAVGKITKVTTIVNGLFRGTPYVVTVIAVNGEGWTSTDNTQGDFVVTPHLDPPKDVRLEQYSADEMKVSWSKNEIALHYEVDVIETSTSNTPIANYKNVTRNFMIFKVGSNKYYKVKVKSTGVTTIPGSGTTVLVSSHSADVSRPTTCLFPPLDVIFVIDVSTKMKEHEYTKSKSLYIQLLFGLSPIVKSSSKTTGTRFAAVKTYGVTKNMFTFERFDSPGNASGAMRYVKQTSAANYNVERMVNYVHTNFFGPQSKVRVRKNVDSAVIAFVGDSWLTQAPDFQQRTSKLSSATNFITVSVSKGAIGASNLGSNKNIIIPTYDDTQMAYKMIMDLLCNLK